MEKEYVGFSAQGLAGSAANVKAAQKESRASQITSRLDVVANQLREVRGMTFAATERILGSEPSPVGAGVAGSAAVPVCCFMVQTENAIGDIERIVCEIRDELGRINRAF